MVHCYISPTLISILHAQYVCIRDKHSLGIMDEKTCGEFEEMFMIYFLSCFCKNSGSSSIPRAYLFVFSVLILGVLDGVICYLYCVRNQNGIKSKDELVSDQTI